MKIHDLKLYSLLFVELISLNSWESNPFLQSWTSADGLYFSLSKTNYFLSIMY